MGVEIERKFLVLPDKIPLQNNGHRFEQGYLSRSPSIRIRLIDYHAARITIKGPGLVTRAEYEYPIPYEDGVELMALSKSRLSKVRYVVHAGHTWEIDRFLGSLDGLWLAEIELESAGEDFERPQWLSTEVTDDPRYSNASLSETGSVPNRTF